MLDQGGGADDADQRQQRKSAATPRTTDGRECRAGAGAVTRRRLSAFVNAIAAGRRPKRFRAESEDAEVVRTAITLRAAHPGDRAPSEAFVEGLFQRLADQANPDTTTELRLVRAHRARI